MPCAKPSGERGMGMAPAGNPRPSVSVRVSFVSKYTKPGSSKQKAD